MHERGAMNVKSPQRHPDTATWVRATATAIAAIFLCLALAAGLVWRARSAARHTLLVQGTVVGIPYFHDGDTAAGGRGQTVDGVKMDAMEQLYVHYHVHLSLFVNGKQLAIPKGIGIVSPELVVEGFIEAEKGTYWLHTHDATGIIHIESPKDIRYTLGQFFAVWGEPLSTTDVAGFNGPVTVYVNGMPFAGNPQNIVFSSHKEITLEVGQPLVKPPVYAFPSILPK